MIPPDTSHHLKLFKTQLSAELPKAISSELWRSHGSTAVPELEEIISKTIGEVIERILPTDKSRASTPQQDLHSSTASTCTFPEDPTLGASNGLSLDFPWLDNTDDMDSSSMETSWVPFSDQPNYDPYIFQEPSRALGNDMSTQFVWTEWSAECSDTFQSDVLSSVTIENKVPDTRKIKDEGNRSRAKSSPQGNDESLSLISQSHDRSIVRDQCTTIDSSISKAEKSNMLPGIESTVPENSSNDDNVANVSQD
jgi:hypothetical protein